MCLFALPSNSTLQWHRRAPTASSPPSRPAHHSQLAETGTVDERSPRSVAWHALHNDLAPRIDPLAPAQSSLPKDWLQLGPPGSSSSQKPYEDDNLRLASVESQSSSAVGEGSTRDKGKRVRSAEQSGGEGESEDTEDDDDMDDDDKEEEDEEERGATDAEKEEEEEVNQDSWPQGEEAERDYNLALVLFQRRCQLLEQSSTNACSMRLRHEEKNKLGLPGQRLFKAMAKRYFKRKRADIRRMQLGGATRVQLVDDKRKHQDGMTLSLSSFDDEVERMPARTPLEKKIRRLRKVLTAIEKGERDPTVFTSEDLASILELSSTRSHKRGIKIVLKLFLKQASKIDAAWLANVPKRFMEATHWPHITKEETGSAQHWLATCYQWKKSKKRPI